MKDSLLVSEEWCEIVFDGRNHRYGAYVLRRDAGRRYRRVALILGSIFAVLLVLLGITGYFFYRAIQNTIEDMQEVVHYYKPLTDSELKDVATGRRAVAHASPDAVTDTPEIVDEAVNVNAPIGIKGPDDAEFIEESSLIDHDPNHYSADESLPVEGVLLTKTDIVEGRPMFPGGDRAMMQFMDAHTVYSAAAIKKKLEGDLEVAFIIDTEGNVIDPEITRSLHPLLDKAVLDAVRQMPKWTPGTAHGRPVCVKISIPVHFQVK